MKKSAYLSDVLFAFVITALPVLCYLRYLRVPLWGALACALLVGGAAAIVTSARFKKKHELVHLRAKERLEAERFALHLAMLPHKERADFFAGVFEHLFEGETAADIRLRQGKAFLESEGFLALCDFRIAPLTADDALPLIRQATDKHCALLCNDLTGEGEEFLRRFDIHILSCESIYARLKKANALPNAMIGERAFVKKRKPRRAVYFARTNSRRCLTGGALLLLSSLIVPFPLYYWVMGGALLVCALLLRIFGVKN